MRPIRVCYADPPYPGCAKLYSKPGTPEYHPDAMRWDDPAEHVRLMAQLEAEFPDGWALSSHANALRELLAGSPPKTRVAVYARQGAPCRWVGRPVDGAKCPVAAVAYMWEPVLYRVPAPARGDPRSTPDFVSAVAGHNNTEPFKGSKPRAFCRWLFGLLRLGGHHDDELVDLFPGSGAVTRAWDDYRAARVALRNGRGVQGALFDEGAR